MNPAHFRHGAVLAIPSWGGEGAMRRAGWVIGLVASFLVGPIVYVGVKLCEGLARRPSERGVELLPGAGVRVT